MTKIETTLGTSREGVEIYVPASMDELRKQFLTKTNGDRPVSVISSGKNWGYGCHAPNDNHSLLIDLSRCDRILEFDKLHGLVTLEPGVTFGQLANFLENEGGEWIAPVIGGGPKCSVVGNALERGYGITPKTDHFAAITQIEAILKNGQIYRGALTVLGQPRLDKLFKYGIGPYYDGIFTQSGLGIVTNMTISLARNPDYAEAFYFFCNNEEELEEIVNISRTLKRDLGDVVGGINLLNRERVLSMIIDYPLDKIHSGAKLSNEELSTSARKFKVTPWLVMGALYGEKEVVNSAKKIIKKRFAKISKKSIYYNSDNRKYYLMLGSFLSKLGLKDLARSLATMDLGFSVLLGRPNNVALKLAYWKHPNKELVKQENLDPNRDGCGLIWYSPLVEFSSDKVRQYVDFVNEASQKFGMNSLITLTTIDARCFDSTVPILFNKFSEEQVERARKFYDYLLEEGSKQGFFPYRLTIDAQKKYQFNNNLFNLTFINKSRYS